MAEKPDFDKIFANKATSVHEWDKDDYDTGWGFLGETPPPYELFDALQRENDNKTKYLSERAEEINTDLTQDINDLQSDLNNKYSELKTGLDGANTALQQHNVDEDAHANLFQRALVTEAKTAANTADWNTLTESRTYKISGATFSADKHQPVGAIGTGELVVLKNGDDTIAQVYYANSAAYDKAGAYHRMCIGGAWTDWVYNITNKGGAVTGDFDINGKLTVDSIQVKDNLYIGDYNPADQDEQNALTAEALQKLQDQIIAPSQTINVDSVNGSDETGDGTSNKPYKTIDFAVTKIKTGVPNVTISLNNNNGNPNYTMHPIDFFNKNTEVFTLIISDWSISNPPKANLTVYNGKCHRYWTDNKQQFSWGNFIAANIDTVNIQGINISIGNDYKKYYDIGFLTFTSNLYMYYSVVNATDYTLQVQEGLNRMLRINNTQLNNYSGLLFANLSRINSSFEEPNENNMALLSNDITLHGAAPTTLQAIAYGSTTIPSAVLDYSLGNKGIDTQTVVLYKNWS